MQSETKQAHESETKKSESEAKSATPSEHFVEWDIMANLSSEGIKPATPLNTMLKRIFSVSDSRGFVSDSCILVSDSRGFLVSDSWDFSFWFADFSSWFAGFSFWFFVFAGSFWFELCSKNDAGLLQTSWHIIKYLQNPPKWWKTSQNQTNNHPKPFQKKSEFYLSLRTATWLLQLNQLPPRPLRPSMAVARQTVCPCIMAHESMCSECKIWIYILHLYSISKC